MGHTKIKSELGYIFRHEEPVKHQGDVEVIDLLHSVNLGPSISVNSAQALCCVHQPITFHFNTMYSNVEFYSCLKQRHDL